MDDLKEKIEALPVHEMDTMQGVIDVVDREAVLVLVATHATEPAPVAVGGACAQCNGSGVVDTPFGLMDRSNPSNRQCDCQWPRADLAPTGNTALVEAAKHANIWLKAALECKSWHWDGDQREAAQEAYDDLEAALSQPAAPQPDGEVEAWQTMDTAPLDGREVLLMVESRAGSPGKCLVGHWMPGGHCIDDHPPIDKGWYFWDGRSFDKASKPIRWMPLPEVDRAALARGSVDGKGER